MNLTQVINDCEAQGIQMLHVLTTINNRKKPFMRIVNPSNYAILMDWTRVNDDNTWTGMPGNPFVTMQVMCLDAFKHAVEVAGFKVSDGTDQFKIVCNNGTWHVFGDGKHHRVSDPLPAQLRSDVPEWREYDMPLTEAAKYIGVCRSTLRLKAEYEHFPHIRRLKYGKRMFRKADLDAYLASKETSDTTHN